MVISTIIQTKVPTAQTASLGTLFAVIPRTQPKLLSELKLMKKIYIEFTVISIISI